MTFEKTTFRAVTPMSLHLVATSIFHADGLSANEIRSGIVGKVVTDGTRWWDYFFADGLLKMLEDGEETQGRWSLQDDDLCFTFPSASKYDVRTT